MRSWHHVPILGDRALPLLGGPEEWLKLLDDHAAGRSHAAFAAHHGAAHHGAAHQVAALERRRVCDGRAITPRGQPGQAGARSATASRGV